MPDKKVTPAVWQHPGVAATDGVTSMTVKQLSLDFEAVKPEKWLPVVGYEGRYEVSDQGRVRSMARDGAPGARRSKTKVMGVSVHRQGYHVIGLSRDGVRKFYLVHWLVLEAFVGPRPPGQDGLHENDVPGDNRLVNLRWGTAVENSADARRNGKLRLGYDHPRAKLTPEAVADILTSDAHKFDLAAKYGVDESSIRAVRRGKTFQ